jgi:hypothetical protein
MDVKERVELTLGLRDLLLQGEVYFYVFVPEMLEHGKFICCIL